MAEPTRRTLPFLNIFVQRRHTTPLRPMPQRPAIFRRAHKRAARTATTPRPSSERPSRPARTAARTHVGQRRWHPGVQIRIQPKAVVNQQNPYFRRWRRSKNFTGRGDGRCEERRRGQHDKGKDKSKERRSRQWLHLIHFQPSHLPVARVCYLTPSIMAHIFNPRGTTRKLYLCVHQGGSSGLVIGSTLRLKTCLSLPTLDIGGKMSQTPPAIWTTGPRRSAGWTLSRACCSHRSLSGSVGR